MIEVTVSMDIGVPATTLFAFVSDFENNPAWQTGVESTEWTSSRPFGMGSTYEQRVGDRDVVISYEVTAINPGRSITTTSRSGATVPTSVARIVQPVDESTSIIKVELVAHPRAWRRLVKPLLTRVIRKSVEADYRRLKRIMEEDANRP